MSWAPGISPTNIFTVSILYTNRKFLNLSLFDDVKEPLVFELMVYHLHYVLVYNVFVSRITVPLRYHFLDLTKELQGRLEPSIVNSAIC